MEQVRSPLHGIPFLVKDVGVHLSTPTNILIFCLERISIDFCRDCIGNAEYSYQGQDAHHRRYYQYVIYHPVIVPLELRSAHVHSASWSKGPR